VPNSETTESTGIREHLSAKGDSFFGRGLQVLQSELQLLPSLIALRASRCLDARVTARAARHGMVNA
jgi:hypothetical protein